MSEEPTIHDGTLRRLDDGCYVACTCGETTPWAGTKDRAWDDFGFHLEQEQIGAAFAALHARRPPLPTVGVATMAGSETIDHPAHYGGEGPYEAIAVIEAWGLGFHLGNVLKYISRAGKKSADRLGDLRKGRWYLDREIARLERE